MTKQQAQIKAHTEDAADKRSSNKSSDMQPDVASSQLQQMQQTVGNQAVQRYLQRDGSALPPVPNYQLTTPSLGQPTARPPLLGGDMHLRLDPEIQAQMQAMQIVQQQLEPTALRSNLLQINLNLPAGPTAPPNPFAAPAVPQPAPTPRGAGPSPAQNASAGDVFKAVIALPDVDAALTSLRTLALDRVRTDVRSLGVGGQVAVVSALATIGAGAVAGIVSDPQARQMALDQLNGRTFPVPLVSGLRVEVNTQGGGFMMGFHLDVGALLPNSLGFGPSSPQAIGGPPQPEPMPGGR